MCNSNSIVKILIQVPYCFPPVQCFQTQGTKALWKNLDLCHLSQCHLMVVHLSLPFSSGDSQLLILSEMWVRFFTGILPTLQAIFYPVQVLSTYSPSFRWDFKPTAWPSVIGTIPWHLVYTVGVLLILPSWLNSETGCSFYCTQPDRDNPLLPLSV
jgi:hypothetical protein